MLIICISFSLQNSIQFLYFNATLMPCMLCVPMCILSKKFWFALLDLSSSTIMINYGIMSHVAWGSGGNAKIKSGGFSKSKIFFNPSIVVLTSVCSVIGIFI